MAVGTTEQLTAHYALALRFFSIQLCWNNCFLKFCFYFLIISEYNSGHYSKCSICHWLLSFQVHFLLQLFCLFCLPLIHFPVLNMHYVSLITLSVRSNFSPSVSCPWHTKVKERESELKIIATAVLQVVGYTALIQCYECGIFQCYVRHVFITLTAILINW